MENRNKFRVWDTVTSTFLGASSGTPSPLLNGDNGLLTYLIKPNPRYIIEFATGLQDKNKKDVYFGDVAIDKDKIVSPIEWHEGFIMFNGQAVTGRTQGDRLGHYMDELEIIGNIHTYIPRIFWS